MGRRRPASRSPRSTGRSAQLTSGGVQPRRAAASPPAATTAPCASGHRRRHSRAVRAARAALAGADVGFGASSDRVVSAGDDGARRSGTPAAMLAFHGAGQATERDFSRERALDRHRLRRRRRALWDAATGALVRRVPGPGGLHAGATSRRRTDELVIGARRATSSVWRGGRAAGACRPPPARSATAGSTSRASTRRGTRLVFAAYATNEASRPRPAHRPGVAASAAAEGISTSQVSPDGQHAAGATEEGDLYVWDLARPARPSAR